MTELKRIDFEKGTFEANGKTYIIEGGLSIERYAEMQILEKEFAYGFTVKGIFEQVKKAVELLNKIKFAEAAVVLYDLMRGATRVQERQSAMFTLCTLFINTPDEDRRAYSKDLSEAKIADWKAAGIDTRDFFSVASSSVNGYLEVYRNVTRIISDLDGSKAAERL